MPNFSDTIHFGHCIFYVRCWQCLETWKVSLHLSVTKSKRRKIIWCVCIFSCSFLVRQNIVKARYNLVYWPKKLVILKICYESDISVEVLQVPLQVFIFSECLFFYYPSCLLYGKDFFQAFRSIANKRYKWFVTKCVYVAMIIFSFKQKKRNKKSSVRLCGRAYFVYNDTQ